MKLVYASLATAALLVLSSCGGGGTTPAIGSGPPQVRENDYRLYAIPGGKVIVCVGWGSSSTSSGSGVGSAISCDWDHPLDR